MTADQAVRRIVAPGPVIEIARTLRAAGYETWCVGGAVRDAMLGVISLDWDLATAATPNVVRKLFRRTIPVGIEFGTVGVLDSDGTMHEVTTFRRDVRTDGRHAVVEFGASLDEDLARRDFTINAIAFDPIAGAMHDPFGGAADLAAGVVRAVGDAESRLREDRLRALRAIRFAARFAFEIEVTTWRAIVGSAPYLDRLSPERVKQELDKTMEQVRQPSRALRRWREAGAFASLVPALATVSDASLAAVDCLPLPGPRTRPQRRALRIAALFGDVDGKSVEAALKALRYSNQDIAWIGALAGHWQQLGPAFTELASGQTEVSDASLRRLAAQVGRTRVSSFLRLAAAQWHARSATALGSQLGPAPESVSSLYRRALRIAFRDAIEIGDLAIDGDDLRSAGIRPGPLYGRVLATLLEDVVHDPSSNQRETLLERARAFAAAQDP